MAESVEHQFLSQCVSDALSQLARTKLYAYVEAERRKFDFACELLRDWSRPLVGQTLWSHTAGIDKDIRTMLLDPEAEICAYIARDTMRARRLLSEATRDFRQSGHTAPHRLRVFWIPQDFDADDDVQRELVREMLTESVSKDILMNVVFGNLTGDDVRFFVRTSGLPGLNFAILHTISTSQEPYLQTRELAKGLGVSPGAVRERLLRLLGCGFLSQFGGGATMAQATLKGRVFLDLCSELWKQERNRDIGPELRQILRLLGMAYDSLAVISSARMLHLAGAGLTEVPRMVAGRLISTIEAAVERWNIDVTKIDHVIHTEQNLRDPGEPQTLFDE